MNEQTSIFFLKLIFWSYVAFQSTILNDNVELLAASAIKLWTTNFECFANYFASKHLLDGTAFCKMDRLKLFDSLLERFSKWSWLIHDLSQLADWVPEILVKPNLISLRINCKYNDHSPNSKWICQIHQKWMYKFCNALRKLWLIFKCIKTNLEGFPGWISCGNEAFIDLEQ